MGLSTIPISERRDIVLVPISSLSLDAGWQDRSIGSSAAAVGGGLGLRLTCFHEARCVSHFSLGLMWFTGPWQGLQSGEIDRRWVQIGLCSTCLITVMRAALGPQALHTSSKNLQARYLPSVHPKPICLETLKHDGHGSEKTSGWDYHIHIQASLCSVSTLERHRPCL